MSSNRRITVLSKKRLYNGYMKIDEYQYKVDTGNGSPKDAVKRQVLEREDAVTAIVHHKETNEIFLTEQVRIAVHKQDSEWMLELPAGVIDNGESASEAIIREVEEEIGYRPQSSQQISFFYTSPGASSERITLFYCTVTEADRVGKGGGLENEGEDIKIISMSFSEAFAQLDQGKIIDAKTIIGLQWLRHQQLALK